MSFTCETIADLHSNFSFLSSIKIKGYRPFRDFFARFESLEVIVGANGSGKSSLFEFLKFLRNACYQEIPPEIIAGSIGQQIFHKPGPDKLSWNAEVVMPKTTLFCYQGELMGPIGAVKILFEKVGDNGYTFLDFKNGKGLVSDPSDRDFKRKEWALRKTNQLALGAITDSTLVTLFNLGQK